MRVDSLVSDYIESKSRHGEVPPSLADKVAHVRRVFGEMDADASGVEFVDAAYDAWNGAAPGTIKRYLVQLKAILNRAFKEGKIARMPVIDMPYVNDTVYVDVTSEEVNRLLDYIKWTERKWYPLTLTLVHTGARLGEAMLVGQSSFLRHGIRLEKRVNRRSKTIERVVPYTGRMRSEIERGYVTLTDGRLAPRGYKDDSIPTCLGRVIDDATKALGLPSLRVHDLRHAFAAVLAENGADLADLMSALGHSNMAMSMRYRGLVRSKLTGIMQGI